MQVWCSDGCPMTRFHAVIFDLFSTLTDNFTPEGWRITQGEMAGALGVSVDDLAHAWTETAEKRTAGTYPTMQANIEEVCSLLGVTPASEAIKVAVGARIAVTRRALALRPGAVETVACLKQRAYHVGLVSNCSSEVPALWEETALAPLIDVPVFSCTAGFKKPDPRIYHLALDHLGLPASQCLYVGDGESSELTGATEAGLHAVRISWPGDEARDPYREPWPRVIHSLGDVLTLL